VADDLRVLTVRQPWAWAIIHGGKDVENRTRSLGPYRGLVAIHVSATLAGADAWNDANVEAALIAAPPAPLHLRRGQVIGVVDLVDEHPDDGDCSPWAMRDHHHLVLTNPRPLPAPIPARGRLGLWRPDDTLTAATRAQLDQEDQRG